MQELQAPASKSISHRALIAAALAQGQSCIFNLLECEDTRRTAEILSLAGASITYAQGHMAEITGMPQNPVGGIKDALSCYLKESGSSLRILAPILAAGRGRFRLFGEKRLHERPARELCHALSALGCRLHFEGKEGHAPFVLETNGFQLKRLPKNEKGIAELPLSIEESSQHLSGLLFASTLAEEPLCLAIQGKKAVSWPYVRLSLDMLEKFGATITIETKNTQKASWEISDWRKIRSVLPGLVRLTIQPSFLSPSSYTVEGDWSAASYLLAAGTLGKEAVAVQGLCKDSCQGDAIMASLLEQMGGNLQYSEQGIVSSPARLKGIEADMGQCPDLVPTVAALAAFAEGRSRLFNIAHLRIKECDRLSACAVMLKGIGVKVQEKESELIVHGLGNTARASLEGKKLCSFGDHRMVMAQSLFFLRSKIPPSQAKFFFDNPQSVQKSFPLFWEEWAKLNQNRLL